MNASGRISLVMITTLCLVMAGLFLGATEVRADSDVGSTSNYYTSFPSTGGPYIIGATWDSNTNVLRVVFNEDLEAASVHTTDFVFYDAIGDVTTLDATGIAVSVLDIPSATDQRVVQIATFTTAPEVGDSLSLATIADNLTAHTNQGINDSGGTNGKDHTHIVITEGPVLVAAQLRTDWCDYIGNNNNAAAGIDLYFDANIQAPAGGYAEADWLGTNEFATAGTATALDMTFTPVAPPSNLLRITRNAGNLRQMWPGVTKIAMAASAAAWVAGTNVENTAQTVMLDNSHDADTNSQGGPVLMGAHYNTVDNTIWAVFSDVFDPATLEADPSGSGQYVLAGGGASWGNPSQASAFPTSYTNVAQISDATFTHGGAATLAIGDTFEPQDPQGMDGPDVAAVAVARGIGILRASYDDLNDAEPANDILDVWFTEPFNSLTDLDTQAEIEDELEFLPTADFPMANIFSAGAAGAPVSINFWNDIATGYGRAQITGFNGPDRLNGERLPYGVMLSIAAGAEMRGSENAAQAPNTAANTPIFEDKGDWPLANAFVDEITSLTTKYYDNSTGTTYDEAYLAWRETGSIDYVDHWLLFSTQDGTGTFDDNFITTYKSEATSVPNLTPGVIDAGVQMVDIDINQGTFTTDDPGHADALVDGDRVWFMLVPVTYWGAVGDADASLVFSGAFTVGPVCPPVDFVTDEDDDMIHVTRVDNGDTTYSYFIAGDVHSAPCGDYVYVYDQAGSDVLANQLGVVAIQSNGSFGPLELTDVNGADPTVATYFLYARRGSAGVFSTSALQILNNTIDPTLTLTANRIVRPDRFNPYQIYTDGDYINILLEAYDSATGTAQQGKSDLLMVTGDFTHVDDRTAYDESGNTDPIAAMIFTALGGDQIDNDGDWDDTGFGTANGNGDMDFPEPYFDENKNGTYDQGETFGDTDGDLMFDGPNGSGVDYDTNLDSADPDEHGYYEVALSNVAANADSSNVKKGFHVTDPATVPDGVGGFVELIDAPIYITLENEDFDRLGEYTSAANPPVEVEIDQNPPTVSEITLLRVLPTLTAPPASGDELIVGTDPTYNLGRYVNFSANFPSDTDVMFGIAQLYVDRSGDNTSLWEPILLDPSGINADSDAPGVLGFDDDGDAAAALTNAADDDEDGTVDEVGEGTDVADAEVVDASQTEAMDTAATGGDGIYRYNDRRDNDNDAFYTFDAYFTDGGNILQRVVWYNIDEEDDNSVDDDNDGTVDEATEVEDDYAAFADDNEDGIQDGEAVQLTSTANTIECAFDMTFVGNFYVDAAHVPGEHPGDADGDIRALTEFIPYGDAVLADGVTPQMIPHAAWGNNAVANDFSWRTAHGGENMDFDYISKLYNMTTDGSTEYMLRLVAYDQAGLSDAAYAVPVTFTLDITAPTGEITDCATSGAPADFVDVDDSAAGIQILDSGSYTLTVEGYDDAVSVEFFSLTSTDGGTTWAGPVSLGVDYSEPFTAEYTPTTLDNDPPDASLLVHFYSLGTDAFSNVQATTAACSTEVTVIDGTKPSAWFTLINTVANPNAFPNAAYYYRDTYEIVQVPAGPSINLHGDFNDMDGDAGTNDVTRLHFEYREAGAAPDAPWLPLETVTGVEIGDPVDSIDMTRPVAVTLDTETMGTGMFDIRIYACDIEGNCNDLTADIATISIVVEGLRAYAQTPLNDGAANTLDLYALTYIHDAEIDEVEFQWYFDADGDGLDDDATSEWNKVDTDDDAMGRGDILLRQGTAAINTLANHTAFGAQEMFYDWDGDGYSERDPIIFDTNSDTNFDAGEPAVVGSVEGIAANAQLTAFPASHFHTVGGVYTAAGWLFQDNALEGGTALEMWKINDWSVVGQPEGNYLIRAVATDEFHAIDDAVTEPSVIPYSQVLIDPTAPIATITEIVLSDATVLDPVANPTMSVDGGHRWFKLSAECAATDLNYITIQFKIPGHGTYGAWADIDVNNDNDFFVDVNGVTGWQNAGVEAYDDEVVLDVNGNFVFDIDTDTVLFAGANGVVNATDGAALFPLVTEDPTVDSTDQDGDGRDGEDPSLGKDYDSPFDVYFVVPAIFGSTVDVNFRAIAYDQTGNSDATQATLDAVVVMLGESTAPETDVIWAKNLDGTEIDVWSTVADGDGFDQIGTLAADQTVRVFATAEDNGIGGLGAVESIDLYWRMNASCYSDLEPWENPWRDMEADGFATQDADAIFEWDVAVDDLMTYLTSGEGIVEFFPRGVDHAGNATVPPEHPWGFNLFTNEALITEDTILAGTVAPGDEYWFEATLAVADPDAVVSFFYGERVLDEVIDATLVSPSYPYTSLALDPALNGNPAAHAELNITEGETTTTGTYYADLADAEAPLTKYMWTMNGTTVEFAVPPAVTDIITISYNVTAYVAIADSDSNAPYTAAWDADDSGVPAPANSDTEAYDIIATVAVGTGDCALTEPAFTEGRLLMLINEDIPTADLFMGGLRNKQPDTASWPGNPSFVTVGTNPPSITEWKMSGVESEAFVIQDQGGVIAADGAQLFIGNADAETADIEVPLAYHDVNAETVAMTFTFYEKDYTAIDFRYPAENVDLVITGGMTYPMAETVAGSGIWQVTGVPIDVNATTQYKFDVDMVGDDDGLRVDTRNNAAGVSSVKVPAVPFWYGAMDTETLLGTTTGVWEVWTIMTDVDGNVGTGNPYKFVYDPVAPTIDALTATLLRFTQTEDVTIFADAFDQTPATFDVITTTHVVFEYCPNYADEANRVWVLMETDNSAAGGWSSTINDGTFDITDPENDFFDNDGDGEWDEVDESTSAMAFRAFALDDGNNYTVTPIELPFTLDSTEPEAVLTAPVDGQIFPWSGGPIDVMADITETQDDILYVLFQHETNAGWVNIDVTPEDNSDDPWDAIAPYECEFDPADYLAVGDSYVRFRALAKDTAGNMDGDAPEVLVVFNDITGPTAYAMTATTTGGAAMPFTNVNLAVTGDGVVIAGTAADPQAVANIAKVVVQYSPVDADAYTEIATDNTLTGGGNNEWSVVWDVMGLDEGLYYIQAIAHDIDGNYDESPLTVMVRVDHTGPSVIYTATGEFVGFANFATYQDDGIVEGVSNVWTPDPGTGDMTVAIITPDNDVNTVSLQYRDDNDPLGAWNAFPGTAALDFETNLTFDYDGTTYYMWRLKIDNFVTTAAAAAGVQEVRALATDYAGNANILFNADNPWETWTLDTGNPAGVRILDNLEAHQVVSGGTVNLDFEGTDALTDIVSVFFEASEAGQNDWVVIDPDPETTEIDPLAVTGENIDTAFARWRANVDFVTPYPLTIDTAYDIRTTFYDAAGNMNTYTQASLFTVEDNIKPDMTKIWAIPAMSWYVDESGGAAGYDARCTGAEIDMLFWDKDGDGAYSAGIDFIVDYGNAPHATPVYGVASGALMNTFPRLIDENEIGGTTELIVAHDVVLVARSQVYDTGLERVEFWAVDADENEMLIGVDDCLPVYASFGMVGPMWNIMWDTEEIDMYGATMWPDGTYTIVARAYDLEGNVEDWDAVDGIAVVRVDNTAPSATIAGRYGEGEFGASATVERNDWFTVLATVNDDVPQDNVVYFSYKRADDLNMTQSWTGLDNAWGVDVTDTNPDLTRPYDFDWDLNQMTVPLTVGETYHVVAYANDVVGNLEDMLAVFEAGNFFTFMVQDTKAPVATITEVVRHTGDTTPIQWPHLFEDGIYARDFHDLTATILDGDADVVNVEFMYMADGSDDAILIDLDAIFYIDDMGQTSWEIPAWDLRTLTPNGVYWVFAVAIDDVGNSDMAASKAQAFKLIVDHSAPTVDLGTLATDLTECAVTSLTFADRSVADATYGQSESEDGGNNYGPVDASASSWVQPYGYYDGGSDATYQIEILSTGAVGTSTYRWRMNSGAWDPVSGSYTTSGEEYLSNGVWVNFVANNDDEFVDNHIFTFGTTGKAYDLTFTSADVDIDRDEVYFEYKRSQDPDLDSYWTFRTVSAGNAVLYDGETQTYSTSWEITDLADGLWDVRLTLYDKSGNKTMVSVAQNIVIDSTDPTVQLTNVIVNGENDTVIDGVDFGTVIDVTTDDVIELWATAQDDEDGIPSDFETGVAYVRFQSREYDSDVAQAWMSIGEWVPASTTPVPLEVTAMVQWHVSGLTETRYDIRALAADDKCNELGASQIVVVNVTDVRPPRARIAAFDYDVETHGDDPKTYCDVYAIAYSDNSIAEVRFDIDADQDGNWITFGTAADFESDCNTENGTGDIWFSTIELTAFEIGDQFDLRAVATDEVPNTDDAPPTVTVEVVEMVDGSLALIAIDELVLVDGPDIVMEGGDDPGDIIVTVEMADATQRPHIMVVGASGPCWIEPVRHVDNSAVWSGVTDLDADHCGKTTIYVSALAEGGTLDLNSAYVWSYEIDSQLGSNGVISVPGYQVEGTTDFLSATAFMPSGTSGTSYCWAMVPTPAPNMSVDQERYLALVDQTSYFAGEIGDDFTPDIGYETTMTIEYSEEAMIAAFGTAERAASNEQYLTVRVYNVDGTATVGEWEGATISHVTVDTENNVVSFRAIEFDSDYPVYALFAPMAEAPVVVSTYKPSAVRYGLWTTTSADPTIVAYLHAGGVEPIDEHTIELWIDGLLYAAIIDGSTTWVRGAGSFEANQANPEATIYEIVYCHSWMQEDWLTSGEHTLNIMFKHDDGLDEWIDLPATAPGAIFYVDVTAPVVEFHGGWVSNPVFSNVSGYLNPAMNEDMLTVRLHDDESGIYVRPEHPEWVWDVDCSDGHLPGPADAMYPGSHYPGYEHGESYGDGCWVEVDYGIKYDIWLVHDEDMNGDEDDQGDIDEIEERLLLHQGTADELIPYMTPPLFSDDPEVPAYMPGDVLEVGLPIMGGSGISDGDVIEVTLYSHKWIEQNDDGVGYNNYDTLVVEDGLTYVIWSDHRYDADSQEMHIYTDGIIDCAWNSGSRYVEQRFVVDASAPVVGTEIITVVPGESFTYRIPIEDRMPSDGITATATLYGPDGEMIEIDPPVFEGGVLTGTVDEGLTMGGYTLKVAVADAVGNTDVVSIPLNSQSLIMTLSETYMYPNPVNPADYNGMIHFNLGKDADVTIKVYDFAGEYVATLASGEQMGFGPQTIEWGGQAADGTDLGNGAYMVRIEANDGSATKSATVKAVIWRQ
jgi:FlgD Ig-like domain